jgi:hypothetical protein
MSVELFEVLGSYTLRKIKKKKISLPSQRKCIKIRIV